MRTQDVNIRPGCDHLFGDSRPEKSMGIHLADRLLSDCQRRAHGDRAAKRTMLE